MSEAALRQTPGALFAAFVGASVAGGIVYALFMLPLIQDHPLGPLDVAMSLVAGFIDAGLGVLLFGAPMLLMPLRLPNVWVMGAYGVVAGALWGAFWWALMSPNHRLSPVDFATAPMTPLAGVAAGLAFWTIASWRGRRAQ